MEAPGPPDYREALRPPKARRIVEALARLGGEASYAQLASATGIGDSSLVHNLNRLDRLGVVEKPHRGAYRLRFKMPFCFLHPPRHALPVAYLGLLGERQEREEPEPAVAFRLLAAESLKPTLAYVATTREAIAGWRDVRFDFHLLLLHGEEVTDIEAVRARVRPQLEALLRSHVVVMDCTSATKPATIAYYELAHAYLVPLVYVYERTRKLHWLLSRRKLAERLTGGAP